MSHTNVHPQAQAQFEISDRATAEKDMEIIRSKRATSTSASAPGQPKSKYRKRSVSAACSHSSIDPSLTIGLCSALHLPGNVTHATSVKRRSGGVARTGQGPSATLVACVSFQSCLSLSVEPPSHLVTLIDYAKLMRKRDKGADGKAAPIDLQTLRASTQSARGGDADHSHAQPGSHHQQSPAIIHAPYEQPKTAPPQQPIHHPAHAPPHPHAGHPSPHPHSYQLMPVAGHPPPHAQMMPPPPPPQQQQANAEVPPPPWMSSSSSSRSGYSTEHQSYLRTSHPPSHARASPQ